MHADSSPTALAHAICQALKACALSDQPLLASCTGGKDSKGNSGDDNGNAGRGGQELDCTLDWDGPPLPPLSSSMKATRVTGK
jgi:hypothetical protein